MLRFARDTALEILELLSEIIIVIVFTITVACRLGLDHIDIQYVILMIVVILIAHGSIFIDHFIILIEVQPHTTQFLAATCWLSEERRRQ